MVWGIYKGGGACSLLIFLLKEDELYLVSNDEGVKPDEYKCRRLERLVRRSPESEGGSDIMLRPRLMHKESADLR